MKMSITPTEIKVIKRIINNQLEPIKVTLMNRKPGMQPDEWASLVDRTKQSILRSPEQYLERVNPEPEILQTILDKIFNELLTH
ncbi:hypothetical protein [Ohtaekwangia sp.]|uniref:hypothetical protein n=1 Tax=Ohtaekwangia sp. TaxID=2066019 RepID=UPI002F95C315